jgi:hypothetical protein
VAELLVDELGNMVFPPSVNDVFTACNPPDHDTVNELNDRSDVDKSVMGVGAGIIKDVLAVEEPRILDNVNLTVEGVVVKVCPEKLAEVSLYESGVIGFPPSVNTRFTPYSPPDQESVKEVYDTSVDVSPI